MLPRATVSPTYGESSQAALLFTVTFFVASPSAAWFAGTVSMTAYVPTSRLSTHGSP
ncbi:hypothetical protein AB0E63_06655 [Kribbella sp. NPDC026596]|uniref:hypothetical protein n=1 Tax=Kribbella sp. NPDC026596 TaxID=3155122 RepID=UPI0033F3D6D8